MSEKKTTDQEWVRQYAKDVFGMTGKPPRSLHLSALAWMVSKRISHLTLAQVAKMIVDSGDYLISEKKDVTPIEGR